LLHIKTIFTMPRSAAYAIVVCLSICLFATSQHSTEMAKHRITEIMPHDSPGTLVLCCQRCWQNSKQGQPGSPPTEAPNAGGVG